MTTRRHVEQGTSPPSYPQGMLKSGKMRTPTPTPDRVLAPDTLRDGDETPDELGTGYQVSPHLGPINRSAVPRGNSPPRGATLDKLATIHECPRDGSPDVVVEEEVDAVGAAAVSARDTTAGGTSASKDNSDRFQWGGDYKILGFKSSAEIHRERCFALLSAIDLHDAYKAFTKFGFTVGVNEKWASVVATLQDIDNKNREQGKAMLFGKLSSGRGASTCAKKFEQLMSTHRAEINVNKRRTGTGREEHEPDDYDTLLSNLYKSYDGLDKERELQKAMTTAEKKKARREAIEARDAVRRAAQGGMPARNMQQDFDNEANLDTDSASSEDELREERDAGPRRSSGSLDNARRRATAAARKQLRDQSRKKRKGNVQGNNTSSADAITDSLAAMAEKREAESKRRFEEEQRRADERARDAREEQRRQFREQMEFEKMKWEKEFALKANGGGDGPSAASVDSKEIDHLKTKVEGLDSKMDQILAALSNNGVDKKRKAR